MSFIFEGEWSKQWSNKQQFVYETICLRWELNGVATQEHFLLASVKAH